MSMYETSIFLKRLEAEILGIPLVYKCSSCESEININSKLNPNTFKDDLSFKEFVTFGLCQKCQDSVLSENKECQEMLEVRYNETSTLIDIEIQCNLKMGHKGNHIGVIKYDNLEGKITWRKKNE